MSKFLSIHEAASLLGVSTQTLRRWEKSGKFIPAARTKGNQRRYDPAAFHSIRTQPKIGERPTIAYARVSSHDQKDDLQRQKEMLEMSRKRCSRNYYCLFCKIVWSKKP